MKVDTATAKNGERCPSRMHLPFAPRALCLINLLIKKHLIFLNKIDNDFKVRSGKNVLAFGAFLSCTRYAQMTIGIHYNMIRSILSLAGLYEDPCYSNDNQIIPDN